MCCNYGDDTLEETKSFLLRRLLVAAILHGIDVGRLVILRQLDPTHGALWTLPVPFACPV